MKESLRLQYSQANNNNERDTLKKVISNNVITKYRMKTKLSTVIGLKGRIRRTKSLKERKLCRLKELNDFMNRDDVTRASAGKKEYRTLHKKRVQVRYLLDTMKNLHTKYKSEGGKLSYAMFTRYKPFYILCPKLVDRNTCACIKHANLSFMANKLKQLKIIESNNLAQLVSAIVCNVNNFKCMYGECEECSKKVINYEIANRNPKDITTWKRWITKKHEFRKKENQERVTITKRTVKEEVTQTLEILLKTFCDQLRLFKKHHFNITHQYKMYRKCKDSLSQQEILLHCDFSENYVCKLGEEVQALHFGASKRQISLHTAVVYAKYQNELQATSFCTISPNTNHSPGAIWAHLIPILNMIKEKYPEVTTLHFYSDGPTTQYRQKKNFYMINKMIPQLGFKKATWSFFEASHGKGAADGIGGAAKRNLDRYVSYGQDIPDAEAAFNALVKSNSKIHYFFIPHENIDSVMKDLEANTLIPVPNTMSIHQIISIPNTDTIKFRKLSCFCKVDSDCTCFNLQEHNLKTKKKVIANFTQKKVNILKSTKKQQIKKFKKRSLAIDDSDTSLESLIDYAESDESIWNVADDLEAKYEDDENIDEEIIEKPEEDNVITNKETEKCIKNMKVTILSDVKNTPDNYRYFNLNNYSPLSLKPIDINFLINNDNLNNIYDNPIPSTSSFNKENCIALSYYDDTLTDVPKEIIDESFNVSDSVIIRYFEKKSWIYYIGFIEDTQIKTGKKHYKVNFLKTLKKPEINFIFPKKTDIDIVPNDCVVKKVQLIEVLKGFTLKNEEDTIYF